MRKKSISLTYNDDEDWRLIVMRDGAMRYEADAIPENLVGASADDLCFIARPLTLTADASSGEPHRSDLPNSIVNYFEWSDKFIDTMFLDPAYLILDDEGRGRVAYAADAAVSAILNGERVYYAFAVCVVPVEAVGE